MSVCKKRQLKMAQASSDADAMGIAFIVVAFIVLLAWLLAPPPTPFVLPPECAHLNVTARDGTNHSIVMCPAPSPWTPLEQKLIDLWPSAVTAIQYMDKTLPISLIACPDSNATLHHGCQLVQLRLIMERHKTSGFVGTPLYCSIIELDIKLLGSLLLLPEDETGQLTPLIKHLRQTWAEWSNIKCDGRRITVSDHVKL